MKRSSFLFGCCSIIIKQNYNIFTSLGFSHRMNSGQKIGLTSSLIKQKQVIAKTNQPEQPVLVAPTIDDKKRLRKKIEQYKRIQRRQYPKKKVIQPEVQIVEEPIVEETVQNVQLIKQEDNKEQQKIQEEPYNVENVENVEEKGKLESTLLQQYIDNQFYDEQCIQADKELQNIKGEEKQFKKKMKKVSSIMERLTKSVHQLKNRYDEMDILELLGRKRNKRRQAEALAFIKSQVEQKKEMAKKYDSIKDSQAKKKEQQELAKKKQQDKQKQKKIKQLKKQFDQKKKEKDKQKKQMQQKEQKAKSFLKNYLLEDPLYKILEQKYEKKQNKEKQVQKAYLKKRREKFKPLDEKELVEHMKIHNEKLRDNQQVKQQEKIEKQQQIIQQNLKLLDKIYRGKNYERVQQQIEEKQRLKLKNKEKRERLKKYEEYVKQNFKPEVREEDQDQNEEENEDSQDDEDQQKQDKQPQYRKIKRYKFLQGRSCGEVIETVKMPLSEKLQRRVGDGYLEHVKSLPKKKKEKDDRNLSQDKLTEAPSSKSRVSVEIPRIPRPKHFKVNLSDSPNRNEISNLLMLLKGKDNLVEMKQRYLCKLSDRSHYNDVQNEINSNIVENIQRKLSLLTKL